MTRQALEAGLHVLVEKPVGIFADEVAEILPVLAERPELVCGVMYNRRAAQAYRHIKNLVQSGELGELVRCSWIITNLYRTEAYYTSGAWRGTWQGEGGGLLMTQASHQLDLMQWICGMPVSVLARCSTIGRPIQVENEAELFLTYLNGAMGILLLQPMSALAPICWRFVGRGAGFPSGTIARWKSSAWRRTSAPSQGPARPPLNRSPGRWSA